MPTLPALCTRKAGVAAELEMIEMAWCENGEFVLHDDLSNVIRVGDVTALGRDGWAWLRLGDCVELTDMSDQEVEVDVVAEARRSPG